MGRRHVPGEVELPWGLGGQLWSHGACRVWGAVLGTGGSGVVTCRVWGAALGTGGSGVVTCSMQGVGGLSWGLGGQMWSHGACRVWGAAPGTGGRGPGATTRLGVELFTFFVAGARDKDILVGESKSVGLGV